jgi:hypothetical protein
MIRLPLLLADPSPCLRWLVLRDLLNQPPDTPELVELAQSRLNDPLARSLLALQQADGSWQPAALSHSWGLGSSILATSVALSRLAYLGFDRSFTAVARAAEYLFSFQQPDGSWPMPKVAVDGVGGPDEPEHTGYDIMAHQTSFPLRGLAACGYAEDLRAERAYDWLLAQRLADGAWPTGVAAGVYGYVAGYRRIPHSRWGCRSNTTGALICLSLHPQRRQGEAARRALDLLMGRETHERYAIGFEVARLVGAEPVHGFITFFARFDLALLLDLCSRAGAGRSDARLSGLVDFVLAQQGPYGLWDYPSQPQATRWVTFDLLRSLFRLDESGDWINLEPHTPFRPYPKQERRF